MVRDQTPDLTVIGSDTLTTRLPSHTNTDVLDKSVLSDGPWQLASMTTKVQATVESGECCKLPQWSTYQSPSCKCILMQLRFSKCISQQQILNIWGKDLNQQFDTRKIPSVCYFYFPCNFIQDNTIQYNIRLIQA